MGSGTEMNDFYSEQDFNLHREMDIVVRKNQETLNLQSKAVEGGVGWDRLCSLRETSPRRRSPTTEVKWLKANGPAILQFPSY